MKTLMLLGYSYRRHVCTHCQKWSDYKIDILFLDRLDYLHVCMDCYEGLVSPAALNPCAGGACET